MMTDGDTRTSAGDPTPAATLVVVAAGEDVHVVTAPADRDGSPRGALPISVDAIAALLERTAHALRNGGGTAALSPGSQPRSALRAPHPVPERLRIGQLEIRPASRLVLRRGDPVPLSRIEFDLFMALVRREGRPATRLELVREVWGFGAAVTSRSVDTQIYNLRHKLEENPANPRHLLTVSGVGYRLAH